MIDPNQPAFPFQFGLTMASPEQVVKHSGLTIRAYIASQQMAALVANGNIPVKKWEVAEVAIQYADMLIDELNKEAK